MSLVYLERRVIALMQDRLGPNRVGPLGLLQPIADVLKLLGKEDIVPSAADAPVYKLATVVVLVPALLIYAVIPFSEKMIIADLNIGILYLVAISSTSAVGILMAGWGSNNKFALLGAMRAVAQIISYEIPLVFSIIGVAMIAGSLSTSDIVQSQTAWGGFRWNHPDPTARFPNLLHRSNRRAEPNALRHHGSGVGDRRRLPRRVQRYAVRSLLSGRVSERVCRRRPGIYAFPSGAGMGRSCRLGSGS